MLKKQYMALVISLPYGYWSILIFTDIAGKSNLQILLALDEWNNNCWTLAF